MEEIAGSLKGKVVLVTGAAGSIGSELCRQLCHFGLKQLVLFDSAETPMHNIRLELEEKFPDVEFTPVMGLSLIHISRTGTETGTHCLHRSFFGGRVERQEGDLRPGRMRRTPDDRFHRRRRHRYRNHGNQIITLITYLNKGGIYHVRHKDKIYK